MYINVHSYYSLCYGTMPIATLIEKAVEAGCATLPLTDINTTMGMAEFVFECRKRKLRPVAGVDFRNGNDQMYVALAKNNRGFAELNAFLTRHNLSKQPYPSEAPPWNDVWVLYPFGKRKLSQLRDNEYIGVRLSQITRLYNISSCERLVAMQPVTFGTASDFDLHGNLRAIADNALLTRLDARACAAPDETLLPLERLAAAYRLYPQLLKNAETLLNACEIEMDGKRKNKTCFTTNVYDDRELLRRLAFDGMAYRYGLANKEAYRRIEKELDIIEKMGFCAYFLIAWDIVRYSMSQGFYHVGRGSGANSIVAYCLKITDVDPVELDLYFERFLNPQRSSPPDFDLDFSWKDRDAVFAYVFQKYGSARAALLGATVTFQENALYRELGKVHGMSKGDMDRLAHHPEAFVRQSELARHIVALSERLRDFPHQRSIHVGGVLITECPITDYTALDMPPKGFPTTQIDMYSADRMGLDKMDILSQRGIAHIRETVEMVRKNRGVTIDIHQVERFKRDEEVNKRLVEGETNGCFYIESPAMRRLLRKLQCSDYTSLVAASSIIRPGVAKSGMMRTYIARFHHPENIDYGHPLLKDLLKETYGVMIYQEDVLKVCHHFAGLDLSDADVLRRMMGHKKYDVAAFEATRKRFFDSCKVKGYENSLVQEIWRQIESFAGYSFSKAHSASYAVESYQSLYLKTHFPLEFQVAVINNFGGFYPTWVYFNEVKRMGAEVHLPCVNRSVYLTSVQGRTVYMGFVHLQGVDKSFVEHVVAERSVNGAYADLSDFAARVPFVVDQLVLLIRSGAFAFTGCSKPKLLWEAHLFKSRRAEQNATLFRPQPHPFSLPDFKTGRLEDAYDEIELYGFPVTMSAFDLLQTCFRGELMAAQMEQHEGATFRMLGRLVSVKPVRTSKGEPMAMGAFIDWKGDFFDTVLFPNVLKAYPFQGDGIYLMLGKVTMDFGQPSLEVEKMARMPYRPDPRA